MTAAASSQAPGSAAAEAGHAGAAADRVDTRIRHIVMWRLRGETAQERADNAARLVAAFASLRGRIPGLLHLEVGVDHSRVDYACDVVLVSEFASQADLDAYATDPEHLRVKGELGDMRVARHQVDYIPASH